MHICVSYDLRFTIWGIYNLHTPLPFAGPIVWKRHPYPHQTHTYPLYICTRLTVPLTITFATFTTITMASSASVSLGADEKGSIPLNMLDWQAQQRALKAADRQSKHQAAETLHSFQNTAVEQSALYALQKEDREKKRMSQEQLHQYRAAFTGTNKAKGDKEAARIDTVQSIDDVTTGIHVLDAVANFNQQPNEPEFQRGEPYTRSVQPVVGETPEPNVTEHATAQDERDGAMATVEAAGDGMVLVDEPSQDSDEWVTVAPPASEWLGPALKHSNVQTPRVVTPLPVEFTFALVSQDQPPHVERYLQAAAFVLGVDDIPTIKAMTCTELEDRPGVYKYMVTCSVNVTMPGHSDGQAKLHVLGLLKVAMRDGSLFTLATSS
jgi:hypothetical protein